MVDFVATMVRMRREFVEHHEAWAAEFAERYVDELGSPQLAMRALASCFSAFGIMMFWKCGLSREEVTRAMVATVSTVYSAVQATTKENN